MMDWSDLFLMVISIIGTLLTYYVIPFLRTKCSESRWNRIMYWVEAAVRYFEENIQGTDMGAEKKFAVLSFLEEKGIALSEEELNFIVDALVNQLNGTEWREEE